MDKPGRPLCAEVSRADDEPLAATASRIDRWLLLEYRGVWPHDAIDGSTLSREVKDWLVAQRALVPHSRLLFVRRTDRRSRDGLVAFTVRSTESGAGARRIQLERYDDLLGLDLPTAGEPLEHPLLLVCTHGKHDRCCAKYGRPLYEALRDQVDERWLWQSTHVGGDRFAGNLVSLPDGLYFGRVDASEAWSVVDEALAGRIYLPRYRGRACYPFAVQAAERAVREHTRLTGVRDLELRAFERAGAGWRVAFSTAAGEVLDVDVAREEGELTHLTCKAVELRRPARYVAGAPRARAA